MFRFPLPQMGFLGFAFVNALIFLRGSWRKLGAIFAGFAVVLAWWLTLKPSNEANWQPDVAQLASAEINGDEVTLRNVRNCDYRTTADYTAHWDTCTVHISQITGIDMAINYWGSPWMAHPIVSFQFADAPICFSIETRKKVGQTYSAVGGLNKFAQWAFFGADTIQDNVRDNQLKIIKYNHLIANLLIFHNCRTIIPGVEGVGNQRRATDSCSAYNMPRSSHDTAIKRKPI